MIVTDSGIVRDTVIRVSDQLDSDALYAISRMLTDELKGMTLQEAGAKIPELSRRMQRNEAVMTGVHQLLDAAAETPTGTRRRGRYEQHAQLPGIQRRGKGPRLPEPH